MNRVGGGHGSGAQGVVGQWGIIGLVGLLIAVGLGQVFGGPDWYRPWMCTPGEVTASFSRLGAEGGSGFDWQVFASLLTCALLHGSAEHLLGNLLFLWLFGALLNQLLGSVWVVTLFGLTALGASLVHTALDPESMVPMLGASGAVMGFEGVYLALATRFSLPDPQVWPLARPIAPSRLALFAVLGVTFDYFAIFGGSTAWIAFGAHVGGFTTGLVLGGLLHPGGTMGRSDRRPAAPLER